MTQSTGNRIWGMVVIICISTLVFQEIKSVVVSMMMYVIGLWYADDNPRIP